MPKEIAEIITDEKVTLEWRDIYESRQTGKVLTDTIRGMEIHGGNLCLVIKKSEAKILIPSREATHADNTPITFIKAMLGAKIDYVITAIDRQSCIAIASRKQAMLTRQKELTRYKPGDRIKGNIVAVGGTLCVVEACGVETPLRPKDIDWGQIPDVRNLYSVGDECVMVIKELDPEKGKARFSIKEAGSDPYESISEKYLVNSIYIAKVTTIPEYGVYCNLSKSIDCLCPHPGWTNMHLKVGDMVAVKVKSINREKRHVRGLVDKLICRG